jgi:hypothetical protein
MDCYSEEADGVEALDELPVLLSEKVATYASMR